MIYAHQITLALTAATGTATSSKPINGRLLAVHLDFSASMASTADTTIKRVSDGAMPEQTLLTITDSATDAWYFPRVQANGSTGSALTGIYDTYPLTGYVSVAIAQGTSGQSLTVTLIYED